MLLRNTTLRREFNEFVTRCSHKRKCDNKFIFPFFVCIWRECVYSRRESLVEKCIFLSLSNPSLLLFTSPRRESYPPWLSSKGSAKPCSQRYFAAAGVIFQWWGPIGRIFLAREEPGGRRRLRLDATRRSRERIRTDAINL